MCNATEPFNSTANSTLATDQLRSLPSYMGLEKFCKAAHEGLSCSFFSSMPNASPHQSGLRTCPWWCHSAQRWRLCVECFSNTLTAPGRAMPHHFLFCMRKALLTPTLWAAMPCSSTSKRRASRSTTGCRKEERACSPSPAFPGPHCWDRAKGAVKAMKLQLIFCYQWMLGHLDKYTVDTIGTNKILLE